mmetsp:Transcript_63073/g.131101  ORF Transcript_63073/g.131101 Transcript_63073/m.131101 type:complete len:314 (+) Transcript_63073:281-1222(+)|eukprot:CAMPEP_0181323580 /NCGR_PEP_ID=MMETSP1101-20121128/19870_1 /TAXON_ID=46948 /ORGANISM="Rhodomonas abbreviata, Strain Caron Lab Isolate" /LENGTH=313 /DNA_ID=CAMNT_0023431635 /DNA_START=280 /DNA_END=1221 /DNA_ORIENTATION=-
MADPLLADHKIFDEAVLTEVRPGRSIHLLHLVAPDTKDGGTPDSEKITYFFVHGSMATMQQFEGQITGLAATSDIVAWDAYGCGKSPKPWEWDAYSHKEHYQDLETIFETYRGPRNVVVGHSYGASMALQLASAHARDQDKPIVSVVCIGPGFGPKHYPSGSIRLFRYPLVLLQLLAPLLRMGFLQRAVHAVTLERKTATHDRLVARILASAGGNPMHVCKAFYQQMEWTTAEELAPLAAPVLILVGEGDRMIPPAYSQALADTLLSLRQHMPAPPPVLLHPLPNTSHQLMQEEPETTTGLIRDFVLHHAQLT